MTANEAIESGTLELYVMGALTPTEMQEIDDLRKTSPQVEEEVVRIEDAMIAFANSHAVKPSADLKEKIASKLEFSVNLDMTSEMVDSIQIRIPGIYKLAAAASLAMIVTLSALTFHYAHQRNNQAAELATQQSKNDKLTAELQNANNVSSQLKQQLAVASNPLNTRVALNGTKIAPNAQAVIWWDKKTGATYLNASALPATAADKQYQLWAIVDGKPVDLGVISKEVAFASMKQIQNASAFAITLEPLGGKATPTLEAMYVMGGV